MANNQELKTIASFALNDVVYSRDWQTDDDWKVAYSARYLGVSGDNTLHFRMLRQFESVKRESEERADVHRFAIPRVNPIPQFWEVRVPIRSRRGVDIAIAAWRFGEGENDVELSYYVPLENGVLVQIEPPPEIKERPMGFRAAIEDKTS